MIESQSRLAETLVEYLKEAGYDARLLTRTRVPIIKLVRSATVEVPESVSCDIGFNNFLAIHNTQLLKTYAACDERLTGMVLFIKVHLVLPGVDFKYSPINSGGRRSGTSTLRTAVPYLRMDMP